MYHSGQRNSSRYNEYFQSKRVEKERKYAPERNLKAIVPLKALKALRNKTKNIQKMSRPSPWELKFERTHYKLLNASAKQKYRSFNVHKKFGPSAPLLLLMDRNRKSKQEKSVGLTVREEPDKIGESAIESKENQDDNDEEEENSSETAIEVVDAEDDIKNDLVEAKREKDEGKKGKELILKQLKDLKKENEELKRRLLEIIEHKKLETALQVQTDNLELERTKLKACWLVMSSTMDAFSNFCRKFTTKSEIQLPAAKDEDAEEFEDALDSLEPVKKDRTCDDKYYNFLNKLMQDQVRRLIELDGNQDGAYWKSTAWKRIDDGHNAFAVTGSFLIDFRA